VARLTNKKPFGQQVTHIEYRQGYRIATKILNSKLSKPAELVESNELRSDINLRLVLGRVASRDVAFFEIERQRALPWTLSKN
jgi:hypothetical protein